MTDDDSDMKRYYRDRAPIYDRVYAYPERQDDLRYLERYIPTQFAGLDILEVAAGTGYWTSFLSRTCRSILAIDTEPAVLRQLQSRPLACPVATRVIDAFQLDRLEQRFDGAFAGLWISHVPKQRLGSFLDRLHSILKPGATLLFLDNSPVQCGRLPITCTDQAGNSYQDRRLDDGSVHRVLKNFPSEAELRAATHTSGVDHKYLRMDNFWLFQYRTPAH
ncbi:MAG: class I SAM-dependent methyltransferase [Gammaproteobacteria bacterium]|nr:class I SAM-dependent methyltransferase [Gammaproteobacteria bacterium]